MARASTQRGAETAHLPNLPLIRQLYHDYYDANPSEQDPYLSSHWAFYSKRFHVALDQEGRIRELFGSGFGRMVTRNPVEPLFAYAGHLASLSQLPNRREVLDLMRTAKSVCRAMGVFLAFDGFKQLCALALIRRWMTPAMLQQRLVVMVIGDGNGFLSAMIKTLYPTATIVLVDLGKTLLFQSLSCQRAHPLATHYGIPQATGGETVTLTDYDFVYCPTERLYAVRSLRYNLVLTIAAMQEMNAETVVRYFSFLRDCVAEEHLFYCCNRESKVLFSGEVSTFAEYPWDPRDHHLVDEPCPWYRYYCSFRTTGPGPHVFGLRVPCVNYFGGPIRHRLSVLATTSRKDAVRADVSAGMAGVKDSCA